MGFFFRSEFEKYGLPAEQMRLQNYGGLSGMDERTRALFEQHLRRGVPIARFEKDAERMNYYMSPGELMGYRYEMNQLLIGKIGQTWLGHVDDRPMMTFAGTRSGKTTTIIEPNLFLYGGSMLVLDPKGELARTAHLRRLLGHRVFVVDPFGQTNEPTASINPVADLDRADPAVVDDAMSVGSALVPDIEGGGNAKHFNDSARMLLIALILLVLTLPESERNLITVRELLCLSYPPLIAKADQMQREALATASPEEKKLFYNLHGFAVQALLQKMMEVDGPFGRVLAGFGARLSQTGPLERGSIFSAACVATDFLDSLMLRRTLRHSDFRIADLRGDQPTTIFLCLPVNRMERHARWFRLLVHQVCSVFERLGAYPLGRLPVAMVLEEFASLGPMPFMEKLASAYLPGFGLKPWYILQDVTQLKTLYKSWDSMLGNAGLVQFFANGDLETIDYIQRRLGKLIAPWEVETGFAREHETQLLLMKGKAPAAALRLSHADVACIRAHTERAALMRLQR